MNFDRTISIYKKLGYKLQQEKNRFYIAKENEVPSEYNTTEDGAWLRFIIVNGRPDQDFHQTWKWVVPEIKDTAKFATLFINGVKQRWTDNRFVEEICQLFLEQE